ncbi:hypothetical protein [Methylopila sp. M107]|uniref:hypothetical protein n=1 Tax=Methylopila sp. M107 TaxID=1101190 RepID=UPI0012DC2CBB|nr:hypothetical protein [Methylopila sp. M107]
MGKTSPNSLRHPHGASPYALVGGRGPRLEGGQEAGRREPPGESAVVAELPSVAAVHDGETDGPQPLGLRLVEAAATDELDAFSFT